MIDKIYYNNQTDPKTAHIIFHGPRKPLKVYSSYCPIDMVGFVLDWEPIRMDDEKTVEITEDHMKRSHVNALLIAGALLALVLLNQSWLIN